MSEPALLILMRTQTGQIPHLQFFCEHFKRRSLLLIAVCSASDPGIASRGQTQASYRNVVPAPTHDRENAILSISGCVSAEHGRAREEAGRCRNRASCRLSQSQLVCLDALLELLHAVRHRKVKGARTRFVKCQSMRIAVEKANGSVQGLGCLVSREQIQGFEGRGRLRHRRGPRSTG